MTLRGFVYQTGSWNQTGVGRARRTPTYVHDDGSIYVHFEHCVRPHRVSQDHNSIDDTALPDGTNGSLLRRRSSTAAAKTECTLEPPRLCIAHDLRAVFRVPGITAGR
jgi:hypothetical protein